MSSAKSLPPHLLKLQHPINLKLSLLCGQVFRFREMPQQQQDNVVFEGSIYNRLFRLEQRNDYEVRYTALSEESPVAAVEGQNADEQEKTKKSPPQSFQDFDSNEQLVSHFLNTDLDTTSIHQKLSSQCEFYEKIYPHYEGLHLLNQPLFECLVAFITSSNNNVKRIMGLMEALATKYGTKYRRLDTNKDEYFYSFPTYDILVDKATEKDLRDLGFGYRAKYIVNSLQIIKDSGGFEKFIEPCLKENATSSEIIEKLMVLPGIGRKVAACIALYGFRKGDVVPLDVHMLRRVNQFLYFNHLPTSEKALKQKFLDSKPNDKVSLNDKGQKHIMEVFRKIFANNAGLAQLYLYASLVGDFKKRLPDAVAQELLDLRKQKLGTVATTSSSKKRKNSSENHTKKRRRISTEMV